MIKIHHFYLTFMVVLVITQGPMMAEERTGFKIEQISQDTVILLPVTNGGFIIGSFNAGRWTGVWDE
jgi:hypothetical protein